ncbi:MAG: DNA-binding protein [Deltaproteobacteria bacterium]|nr:DNA-binding protein [Deltaproteobacteria bacterium]
MDATLLDRNQLAERWCVSVRTVDRARQDGRLPWIDLARGRGARPCVRFRLDDVERYEAECRIGSGLNKS